MAYNNNHKPGIKFILSVVMQCQSSQQIRIPPVHHAAPTKGSQQIRIPLSTMPHQLRAASRAEFLLSTMPHQLSRSEFLLSTMPHQIRAASRSEFLLSAMLLQIIVIIGDTAGLLSTSMTLWFLLPQLMEEIAHHHYSHLILINYQNWLAQPE